MRRGARRAACASLALLGGTWVGATATDPADPGPIAGAAAPAGALAGLAAAGAPQLSAVAPPEPEPAPAAADRPIAPPPEFERIPPRPAVGVPSITGVVPQGGTWAVIVGIDDYPGTAGDLRAATADAHDVDAALDSLGVPRDHRLLVTGSAATAATLRASLDWLAAHAGPDAVAVFSFAGHVREVGRGQEAMVLADGELVGDREFAERLGRVAARRQWIVMAACYGGGFDEVLAPGRVLTAAAPAGKVAYENDQLGRSYLGEYVVRQAIVQKRAHASVQSAFAWGSEEIRRRHPGREPVQIDRAGAPLDLRPPPPPGAPPSPAPKQPAPRPTPTTAPPREDDCSIARGVVTVDC